MFVDFTLGDKLDVFVEGYDKSCSQDYVAFNDKGFTLVPVTIKPRTLAALMVKGMEELLLLHHFLETFTLTSFDFLFRVVWVSSSASSSPNLFSLFHC